MIHWKHGNTVALKLRSLASAGLDPKQFCRLILTDKDPVNSVNQQTVHLKDL